MLDNLTQRLSGVIKNLRGQARLTESNIQDALREVRMALLEADVALPVVKDFIAQVKEAALGQEVIGNLNPGQALIGVVHRELTKLMGEHNDALNLATTPPAVILMAGLQGAGKTTTSGKLAKLLRDQQKKKVLLVSCDVYRPAAIEQLRTLAQQLEIDFFASDISQKPQDIALAAHDYAKRHYHDVLIVDTAGRLAIDAAMMEEIKQLHAALKPIETLFVVDAMTGQDAVNTAKTFNDRLDFTGVVLTKLDGDTRGGAALSIKYTVDKPIKFVSSGEKMDTLDVFYPERMAQRILGMGDITTLVEKAQAQFDEVEAKKLEKKIRKNQFDFQDFLDQLQQIKKMGNLKDLMGMIPGVGKAVKDIDIKDDAFKGIEAMISSMTPHERANPDSLTPSRRARIAKGAGKDLTEVNAFMKQFEQMKQKMKMMNNMPMGGRFPGMKR